MATPVELKQYTRAGHLRSRTSVNGAIDPVRELFEAPAPNTNAVPNPGSEAAQNIGCTCAVMDNHCGRGVPMGGTINFWISGDCPVHARPAPERTADE